MPHGWPAGLGPLLAAGRDSDAEQLHRIAASARLLRPDAVTPAALLALLDPYLQPLRSPVDGHADAFRSAVRALEEGED